MERKKIVASKRHRSAGMTLLEMVLALSLSALLLMAISMALQIHWKAFDVRRSRVEEAQLATSILRRVSDDIRSTLKFEPPDLSGLNFAAAVPAEVADLVDSATGGDGGDDSGTDGNGTSGNASGNNNGGGMPPGGDGGTNPQQPPTQGGPPQNSNGDQGSTKGDSSTGGTGTGGGTPTGGGSSSGSTTGTSGTSSGDSAGGSASDNSQSADTGAEPAADSGPSVAVGLYGSATQLQFDISRLPRVDQYQSSASADGQTAETPSDIKTIVYFLQSDDSLGTAGGLYPIGSGQPSLTGTGRGLMRSESDRAVSAFGELNGSTESIYGGAKLLAAEVTSLQFQYYDGVEWLPEWDSDELEGLPLAIEVQFTLDTTGTTTTAAADPLIPAEDQKVFRMVIQLPVGGKNNTATSAETTETETMDGSDTSGETGSTSSGGTDTTGGTGTTGGSGSTGAPGGGTMP